MSTFHGELENISKRTDNNTYCTEVATIIIIILLRDPYLTGSVLCGVKVFNYSNGLQKQRKDTGTDHGHRSAHVQRPSLDPT